MPSHRRQQPSNRTKTQVQLSAEAKWVCSSPHAYSTATLRVCMLLCCPQIVAGAQEQPAAKEQQQTQGSTHTPAHRARSPAQPQRVPQWPGSTDAWQVRSLVAGSKALHGTVVGPGHCVGACRVS